MSFHEFPRVPSVPGLVFDLDTFAIHDGPGIRLAVYLKGCPLSCRWCHSPESRGRSPELIFARQRCLLCGACVKACPRGVHTVECGMTAVMPTAYMTFSERHEQRREHRLNRQRCQACGRCVAVCSSGALAIKGYTIGSAEIVVRAARMAPFFRHSGGGITLTGGEVTQQPEFAVAVLQGCREQGIPTAIETSGACPWPVLERLLAYTDLVLYDLKLADDAAHRQWTGVSNWQILDNAARLAGRDVEVRVPLIPGITDTEENLRGIFALMRRAGLPRVALLPYNPSAGAKYEWLDQPYTIQAGPQGREQLERFLALAREAGVEAVIG